MVKQVFIIYRIKMFALIFSVTEDGWLSKNGSVQIKRIEKKNYLFKKAYEVYNMYFYNYFHNFYEQMKKVYFADISRNKIHKDRCIFLAPYFWINFRMTYVPKKGVNKNNL
jgi:hypothetical protein